MNKELNRLIALQESEEIMNEISRKAAFDKNECNQWREIYIINLNSGKKVKKTTKLGKSLIANKQFREYTKEDYYG